MYTKKKKNDLSRVHYCCYRHGPSFSLSLYLAFLSSLYFKCFHVIWLRLIFMHQIIVFHDGRPSLFTSFSIVFQFPLFISAPSPLPSYRARPLCSCTFFLIIIAKRSCDPGWVCTRIRGVMWPTASAPAETTWICGARKDRRCGGTGRPKHCTQVPWSIYKSFSHRHVEKLPQSLLRFPRCICEGTTEKELLLLLWTSNNFIHLTPSGGFAFGILRRSCMRLPITPWKTGLYCQKLYCVQYVIYHMSQ